MTASTTPADVESLRQAFAALNRDDVETFARVLDESVVRIEPPDFPDAGTYRGIEAVTAHVRAGRGTWAEGACEPTRFVVAGDRVVALLSIHVRLHGKTDWIDAAIADVFIFREGKAVEWRSFTNPSEALAWAGAT